MDLTIILLIIIDIICLGIIFGTWFFYHPEAKKIVRKLKKDWLFSWTGGRGGCLLQLISEE